MDKQENHIMEDEPQVNLPVNEEETLEEGSTQENIDEIREIQDLEEIRDIPKGQLLRAERERQGLSLEVVHEATKIPLDAIRAIEEGYTVRTISTFYIKGFLKIYATYLGMDVEKVVDGYKSEELPRHIDGKVSEFDPILYIADLFPPSRRRFLLKLVGISLCLFILFKGLVGLTSKSKDKKNNKVNVENNVSKSDSTQKAVEKKKKKKEVKEEKKAVVPVPVDKVPEKVAAKPVVALNVTLTVRAQKDSWLRVKSDGKVVFQSTLRMGTVETWIANEQLEISGKNIGQLEFELNGKMIGTLSRGERKAKSLIVTKEGLKVTK